MTIPDRVHDELTPNESTPPAVRLSVWQELIKRSGRMYECPECGRLMWSMPGNRWSTFSVYKPEDDAQPGAAKEFLERAKTYQGAIREVLMREWDPIGAADVAQLQTVYDEYINHIYGILIRPDPKDKLVEFLWSVETEIMGLYGTFERTERTVDLLLKIVEPKKSAG
jgi:hypothetical protein